MLESSYDIEVVFMLFKDWLKQFSGSPEFCPDNVLLQTVLNMRYENLRYMEDGDAYKLTDYTKARINPDNASIEKFAKQGFDRIKSDYKNVKLLVNSDTDKDGSTKGWFYRRYYPRPKSHPETRERLSLNVYMAPGLIKKLDEIVNEDAGKHISEYKTPSSVRGWSHRHDPITIYFYSLTPDLLQKVIDAIKPYLRPAKSAEVVAIKNPYSVQLPNGIYYNKEWTKDEINALFDNIKKFFPAFENEARAAFDFQKRNVLSAGQVYVLRTFQKQLAQDIDKIDKKSIEDYLTQKRISFTKRLKDGASVVRSLLAEQKREDEHKLNAFIERFSQKSKK